MTESLVAGTELKLTARIEEDGTLSVQWDHLPQRFLFHDGFAAILRKGNDDTADMVELERVRVDYHPEANGHVEPLLSHEGV
jgi:hypothetical protein